MYSYDRVLQPNQPKSFGRAIKARKYFHKLVSKEDIDMWTGCDGDDEEGA
jgi:hypothetical protein